MTQREATFQALNELGVRTSLQTLAKRASIIYGSNVYLQACCNFRSQYCKRNNIATDCRTYAGQPRRNMLKDEQTSLQQVKRLNNFFRVTKSRPTQLRDLIGNGEHRFHSLEQLTYALTELEQLQQAA